MGEPRRVLVLGGSQVAGVFEAIERRGARAVVLEIPEMLRHGAMPSCVDRVDTLDLAQPPLSLVRAIRATAEAHRCVAIVPVSEYALVPAALVAQQMRLPGLPVKVVQNTRDKARMRSILSAAGVDRVRHARCDSANEGRAFLAAIGGPIVVKPVLGTASDGVSRVDRADQIPAAFALAGQARAFGGVLCEELIDGPEVSVEGVSVDGAFTLVAVTDKVTDERFLETGHSQPTAHSSEALGEIGVYVARVLAALGVTEGLSHTEIKLTPSGPALIETHTRMGGDNIHVLTRHTTGVDLPDLAVAFALGEKPSAVPQPTGMGAAIRFLKARPGRIEHVHVPSLVDGIEAATAHFDAGALVGERSSSLDRLAHVVAIGETAAAACRAAEEFCSRIVVRYVEQEGPWTAQVA